MKAYLQTLPYMHSKRSLEEDIKYIIAAISEINTKKHLTTIRWDRGIMTTSIRKKQTGKGVIRRNLKFTYAHMYDGVHPGDYLRDKWFKYSASLSSMI